MPFRLSKTLACGAALLLATLVACKNVPDKPREYDLDAKDLVSFTDQMATEIAKHPEFVASEKRIVVVMDRVVNRTTQPNRDFDAYLARIRRELNRSLARRNFQFLEDRAMVEKWRRREGLEQGGGGQIVPDYVFTATFYDSPSRQDNIFVLDFKIASIHTREIVWEGGGDKSIYLN